MKGTPTEQQPKRNEGQGSTNNRRDAVVAITLVMVGCCCNVITLEAMTKHDPGAGNVVTLSQFAFVSAVGLAGQIERVKSQSKSWRMLRLKERHIPLLSYAAYVALFFTVSVLNNAALSFHIAIPFHTIFRSGSLITSLVLGAAVLGKRYTLVQCASVLCVTAGIFVATSASLSMQQLSVGDSVPVFITGIAILSVALVLSSVMGIFQEHMYTKYGKHTQEHQFYSHALSLPFFIGLLPDVIAHVKSWSTMALVTVPFTASGTKVSLMWVYLAGNVVTQWVCISGVFKMTGAAGALGMTLTISIRKFVSLLLSIWFFRNPFTPRHWIATALVFGGTLAYSWPKPKPAAAATAAPKPKEE